MVGHEPTQRKATWKCIIRLLVTGRKSLCIPTFHVTQIYRSSKISLNDHVSEPCEFNKTIVKEE
jgi:hypothetical protein